MPGTKTAEQLKAILKEQRDAALAVQQVTAEKRVQDEALETEKASSRVFIKDTKNKENKEDPEYDEMVAQLHEVAAARLLNQKKCISFLTVGLIVTNLLWVLNTVGVI